MRRDRLEQKVLTYIKAEGMIESGSRVLLAVSGGADSMALVAIFVTLAAELNIELAVAHLDHGLRPSSWQEAELVEMYCRQFKLPLYAQTTDVGMYCREQGLGIESGAREVRHRWLREAAAQFGAGKIATAHHRDDQVETILLHLLRGSGLKGLGGMAPAREIYLRPLLTCSKAELVAYLERRSINYLEDESNADITYLRNRVRHQLLPLLEADYNQAIRERLFSLGEAARQDYNFLQDCANEAMKALVKQVAPTTWGIELAGWLGLAPAIQAQIVMRTLALVRGQDDFTSRDVEAIMHLARSQGSAKKIQLSSAIMAACEYGMLYLSYQERRDTPLAFSYQLSIPGQVKVTERALVIKAELVGAINKKSDQLLMLDAESCPPALEVRNRRSGDRISLPGGTKKLSDWYIDHKVPVGERDQKLLLVDGQQVIWIEGGPVAVPYRPRTQGRRVCISISQKK